jgi:hypothetical protein
LHFAHHHAAEESFPPDDKIATRMKRADTLTT